MSKQKTDLVWGVIIDNKYNVSVYLVEEKTREGVLEITNLDKSKVLHEEPVGVSYGAPFGPDVLDIEVWGKIATSWIDNNMPPPSEKSDAA